MSLEARFAKLEARERKLMGAFGVVLVVFVLLLLPLGVGKALYGKRAQNQEVRELVQAIQDARGLVTERKAKHDALLARYAKPAPQLGGFIEEAAKANGIAVPEAQDRPEVPHGKRYGERVTVVKMHKVGMLALAKTLEKIEQSGHPVAITKLNIKPRSGEPDSYEVELGVSAFDRKGEAGSGAASGAAPAGAASGAASGAGEGAGDEPAGERE